MNPTQNPPGFGPSRRLTAFFALLLGSAAVLSAATYYVDSAAGSDGNTGTTSATAWQTLTKVNATTFVAGDSVLFKRGGAWTGQLHPLGSGSSSAQITIDAYGSGAAPLIQGAGAVSALLLSNQQYWSIRNLEITNTGTVGTQRRGVHILATDAGKVSRIHLIGLTVHDVTGDTAQKHNAGIHFQAAGTVTPTYFDDVVIEECYVYAITRSGISSTSSWNVRTGTTNTNWTPSTNVVIKNNVIADCAGNGLLWLVASAPHIYGNVFAHNGATENGNAVFPYNCDDALLDHNEAYGTVYNLTNSDNNGADKDAGGFDADYECKNTIIEYNYAHDNDLAGIIAVSAPANNGTSPGFNQNPVIRYNILQNNDRIGIRVTGFVTGARIYNNTLYFDSAMSAVTLVRHGGWSGVYPDDTQYKNNVIVNHSTTSTYDFSSSTNTLFDYNVFYGQHPATEPTDAHKLTSDPRLADAGTGSYGWDSVDGYRLLSGSPAIGSGVLISGNGGADYFGNAVSSTAAPNRGVDNGAGLAAAEVRKEFESLAPVASSGQTVEVIADAGAQAGNWVKYYSSAVNHTITYAFYVPAGTYSLAVRSRYYNDRGIVQLATSGDGTTFANKDAPKDLYSSYATWATISYTDLVTFPTSGTKYFRFTVTGKNAASSSYLMSLDQIVLTKRSVNQEFENLPIVSSSGAALDLVADVDASHGLWTKYQATGTGQQVTYGFYVPTGTYTIQVRVKAFTDRGLVQLATSGDGTTFYNKDAAKDLYAASAAYTTFTYTDTVTFTADGVRYFRFTTTGKNAASTGYVISLDSITLIPQ